MVVQTKEYINTIRLYRLGNRQTGAIGNDNHNGTNGC